MKLIKCTDRGLGPTGLVLFYVTRLKGPILPLKTFYGTCDSVNNQEKMCSFHL